MTLNTNPFQVEANPKEISPYVDFAQLWVPSNTADTPWPFKVVVVTTPGTITWLNMSGQSQTWFAGIQGMPIYIRGTRIMSTGTTATGIYIGTGQ